MPELNKTILLNSANLKAYYRFESGALTTDSSGNGHTLTNQTAVGETTGIFGGGGAFNGSHYMYTANTTALNITGNITVGCWVYFNAVAEKGLVSKGLHGDSTFQWALRTTSGTSKFAFSVDDNGTWGPLGDAVGTTVPTTGVWYFVVGVYDGAAVRIYVNGKCETSAAYSSGIVSKTGAVYVGTFFDTSYLLNATIDEVFIFNSALSADQIKELYEGRYLGELRPNQFGTTAALYHLSSTTDAGGNNYHLTNNGTVTFVAGKFVNCADFGSANSTKSLSRTDNLGLTNSGAKSFLFWMKEQTAPTSGQNQYLVDCFFSDATREIVRYINSGGTLQLVAARNRSAGETTLTYNVDLGTTLWHHIAYVSDNSTIVLYLDGNVVASGAAAGVAASGATARTYFGADVNAANFYKGYMDELYIPSTALTANQIRTMYALGVGKYY